MDFLPVSLRVRDTKVLLVGGGQIATRKARLLLKAGAQLAVVSPTIDVELQQLLDDSKMPPNAISLLSCVSGLRQIPQ